MSKKHNEKSKRAAERFVRSDNGEAEVPPVIIKGGSDDNNVISDAIDVEHPRVAFDDPVNQTKVVKTIGPLAGIGHVGTIQLVELRDATTKVVLDSMAVPAGVARNCLIMVWDDQV